MAYIGQTPTRVPLTSSDITDGSISSADIADLDAAKLTGTVNNARISLDAAEIPNLDTAKVTSGTFADARISAGSVTQHVTATDLTPVRQDIAMLALYNAVSDNRAAYNLPFSFIDQFEDDTGVTTQTDVDNVSEYFSSIYTAVGQFTSDANTKLLMHMDDSALTTDSGATGHTITNTSATRSSTQSKYGGYSAYFNGSSYLTAPNHADWSMGTGDFTLEFWYFTGSPSQHGGLLDINALSGGFPVINTHASSITVQYGPSGASIGNAVPTSTWKHIAACRDSGTMRFYADGVQVGSATDTTNYSSTNGISVGRYYNTLYDFTGYMDEVRISNTARYPSGTTFTPNQISAVSATGTLISDTQTSSVATTKMSGVILYKDNGSGASTLGTHLKIYLSANGGSNWHEVPSYGAVTPLFSTGVKMVRLGETTVTSGTTPVMKAVWASQASGTLETQLHGWAMNY